MATIDTLINSIDGISTLAVAKEFIETEMGGQFNERSLSIRDNGVNFTLRVTSPFTVKGEKFENGDTVCFDKFANIEGRV